VNEIDWTAKFVSAAWNFALLAIGYWIGRRSTR